MAVVTALTTLLVGCELDEVTAPPAEDLLVVEAVLRAGRSSQYVLLHHSVDGTRIPGESGARVEVIREDGRVIPYAESTLEACSLIAADNDALEGIQLEASCYISDPDAGYFVRPGRTYELYVETSGGQIARGRTTLPDYFGFAVPAVWISPRTLMGNCIFPSRPFTMVWRKAEGAWSYVLMLELSGWSRILPLDGPVTDPLQLVSISVSANDTTVLFPTNIGLFQRADFDQRIFALFEDGIPPGVQTRMVVMAAERNYTNAIRGGRFNPSGQIRLSSVVGDAVGVFGGVVPIVIESMVVPGVPAPPCRMPPT